MTSDSRALQDLKLRQIVFYCRATTVYGSDDIAGLVLRLVDEQKKFTSTGYIYFDGYFYLYLIEVHKYEVDSLSQLILSSDLHQDVKVLNEKGITYRRHDQLSVYTSYSKYLIDKKCLEGVHIVDGLPKLSGYIARKHKHVNKVFIGY